MNEKHEIATQAERQDSQQTESGTVEQTEGALSHNASYPHKKHTFQDHFHSNHAKKTGKVPYDERIELTEEDAFEQTGFAFPAWKKWTIISVIFVIQCSMNLNASLYSNGVTGLTEEFGISKQAARVGQCVFLVLYAFGCELWAPWSEEFGRWPIMQLSLGLVNLWQIPCALAPNYGTIIVGRSLGGLSSAGGSVTLGMVADMWNADDQQYAVAYIVLSSVGGSVLGPVVGGFVEKNLSWHWVFWVQLLFGGATQLVHFLFVPETRTTIMLDREARRRREATGENIYGPNEMSSQRISFHEILVIWYRPFEMFVTEPIVLCLSLLSGFSDALIFTFLEAYTPVYKQWGFGVVAIGLAFIPLLIGYFIAYFSFFPSIASQRRKRAADPKALQPEARLWWLLYTVPFLPIGLIGFAWTSLGPSHNHWMGPMFFSALVGLANYAIYMATIDYMIAAYGPYSASATGGNGMARDFLAGIAALYSTPFYEVFPGEDKLAWPTTILAIIGVFVAIPVYIFYWKGPLIRKKSKFAATLAADGKAGSGSNKGPGRGNTSASHHDEKQQTQDTTQRPSNARRGTSVASQGNRRGHTIRRRSMVPTTDTAA